MAFNIGINSREEIYVEITNKSGFSELFKQIAYKCLLNPQCEHKITLSRHFYLEESIDTLAFILINVAVI